MIRSLIVVGFFSLMLSTCGPSRTDPDPRDGDACASYTGCGECAGQPQCGWCITEGVGRCIASDGETDRASTPSACTGSWHFRIADDPELPAGEPPYCPAVPSPEDTAGAEEPAQDTAAGEESGEAEEEP